MKGNNDYQSVRGATGQYPPIISQLNHYGRNSQISSSSNSGAMMLPQIKSSKFMLNNRDKMIARANHL